MNRDDANVLPPLIVREALAILGHIHFKPERYALLLLALGRRDVALGDNGVGPLEVGSFDEGGIADSEGGGGLGGFVAGAGGVVVVGSAVYS